MYVKRKLEPNLTIILEFADGVNFVPHLVLQDAIDFIKGQVYSGGDWTDNVNPKISPLFHDIRKLPKEDLFQLHPQYLL